MQITGRVTVNVDGMLLRSKSGAKLSNFAGVERSAVIGANGVNGYVEKTVVPSVECSISHSSDTSLVQMAAWSDVTVNFITDTGTVYSMPHAWLANALDLTEGEGDVTCKFEGTRVEEIR